MTWILSAGSTQTAVLGVEHVLQTDPTNATYYFEVDMSAMVAGDVTELRIYVITLAAGTSRVAWKSTYGPVASITPIAVSPSQPSDQALKVTLKQTSGTGRAYPWKLLRI